MIEERSFSPYLITKGLVRPLNLNETICIERTLEGVHLLVTGMPRWGKTTALQQLAKESPQTSFAIVEVQSPMPKPKNIMLDDYDALFEDLSFANSGLVQLTQNFYSQRCEVFVYERGFVDQIAFMEALQTMWGKQEKNQAIYDRRQQKIIDFKNYFRHFLPMIDGVIICNSSPDISLQRGSKTNPRLLELLSEGYNRLPQLIAELMLENIPLPVIELEFDKLLHPEDTLKTAVLVMANWNLMGKISNVLELIKNIS